MIENEKQYWITESKLNLFNTTLQQVREVEQEPLLKELFVNALESQIKEFKADLLHYTKNNILRRNRMDMWHRVEKMTHDVMQEVEEMGADIELTNAVVLLGKARECVANFIDKKHVSEIK